MSSTEAVSREPITAILSGLLLSRTSDSGVVRIASAAGGDEEILVARGELLSARAGSESGVEAFRRYLSRGFSSKRLTLELRPRSKGTKRQISASASAMLLDELAALLVSERGYLSQRASRSGGTERSFTLDAALSFFGAMVHLERRYRERGRSLDQIFDSPHQLVERSLQVVPDPSPWNEALGAFYDTSGVRRVLGDISRQAVMDRVRRRTLLGLKTADGKWVYPVAQFTPRNEVVDGLAEILQGFDPTQVDDWTLAGWLASDTPALDGLSPLDWLRQGRDVTAVLTLARDAARRLAA